MHVLFYERTANATYTLASKSLVIIMLILIDQDRVLEYKYFEYYFGSSCETHQSPLETLQVGHDELNLEFFFLVCWGLRLFILFLLGYRIP